MVSMATMETTLFSGLPQKMLKIILKRTVFEIHGHMTPQIEGLEEFFINPMESISPWIPGYHGNQFFFRKI